MPVRVKTKGTRKDFIIDQGVAFQQVSYAYQDGERPALKMVDFTLLPGKKTALVGASGAGKEHHRGDLTWFPPARCWSDPGWRYSAGGD